MYMSMIFTTCIYHVCQLLYYSMVQQLTDMVQTCLYTFMPGGQDSRR